MSWSNTCQIFADSPQLLDSRLRQRKQLSARSVSPLVCSRDTTRRGTTASPPHSQRGFKGPGEVRPRPRRAQFDSFEPGLFSFLTSFDLAWYLRATEVPPPLPFPTS